MMANQQQLDLLQQGVDAWNRWRRQHEEVRPDLSYAHLNRANLNGADLSFADLNDADLSGARMGGATLGDIDLRTVKGLETIFHFGPSTIGTDTISRSEGDIPDIFLRGAGLSDTFITYTRSLAQDAIEYYTCF